MRYEELPGCCGVNIFHHFNDTDGTRWTFGNLARALDEASEDGMTQDEFVRPVVTFVHSSSQDAEPLSPRRFAQWLTELREPNLTVIGPITHDRHGTQLTYYVWQPSQGFKDRLFRAMERHGLAENITYRPGGANAPRPAPAPEAARQAAAAPAAPAARRGLQGGGGGNAPANRNRR